MKSRSLDKLHNYMIEVEHRNQTKENKQQLGSFRKNTPSPPRSNKLQSYKFKQGYQYSPENRHKFINKNENIQNNHRMQNDNNEHQQFHQKVVKYESPVNHDNLQYESEINNVQENQLNNRQFSQSFQYRDNQGKKHYYDEQNNFNSQQDYILRSPRHDQQNIPIQQDLNNRIQYLKSHDQKNRSLNRNQDQIIEQQNQYMKSPESSRQKLFQENEFLRQQVQDLLDEKTDFINNEKQLLQEINIKNLENQQYSSDLVRLNITYRELFQSYEDLDNKYKQKKKHLKDLMQKRKTYENELKSDDEKQLLAYCSYLESQYKKLESKVKRKNKEIDLLRKEVKSSVLNNIIKELDQVAEHDIDEEKINIEHKSKMFKKKKKNDDQDIIMNQLQEKIQKLTQKLANQTNSINEQK